MRRPEGKKLTNQGEPEKVTWREVLIQVLTTVRALASILIVVWKWHHR